MWRKFTFCVQNATFAPNDITGNGRNLTWHVCQGRNASMQLLERDEGG